MSTDSRRVYILRVASHILSLNLVEEKLPNVQALQNFCDTAASLLVISRVDQKGHVDVSNEISGNKQALFRVIFYKNRPVPLSADGYKTDISVITIHQNATETFLGSIQQVFSKALEQNTNGSKNKQLLGLIHELEENLQTAVGGSSDSAKGITSLEDEINQWIRSAQNNKDPGNYSEALEPLAEQYNAIKNSLDSSFVLDDLFGFVEAAEESVDTLWNAVDHPYPQKRMKQLIEIIGEQLYQFIVARIQPVSELWRSKTSPEALRSSIALVDQWIDAVELLTAKSWPSNPLNEWKGAPMSMEFCVGFKKRLEEIFSLRTLPDQLVGLLRDSSILPQIQSSIESAMRNFNPCVYTLAEADQTQWRMRLNSAEKGIDGLMERAIPELRARLQPSQADLNGVLEDMYSFRNFLNRKSVMERMQVEREALISRLLEYLQVQRKEYNDYVRNSAHAIGKFLTEIASKIIWIRSHVIQAEKMKRNSEPLLNDLPGYKRLVQALDTHLEELRAAESENFDSWCRDMISHTGDDNDSIALQTAGRLMILERERGLLNVSYSDRLARLLSEVRQLQSLGFQIPTKIMNFVQVGQKYYQYGIVLKQVAHFYNTIEQQMLPCQQSMMLEEALAFERLVLPSAKPNEYSAVNITWDNPERLKAYIEKLKEAAQKLTDHNRRLRRSHAEIGDLVVELLHIDLLKEEDKWDKKLLSIRQKFADEERYVTQKQNMRAWAVHWDRQLYKTLQLQFQWGLESLQHQIPTIHAQLIMREQTLQLRPPIEELKSSYYKEVKKFLSIPQRFRGIQNISKESSLFVVMVKRNATRFHHIYEQSEQLFQQLYSIDSQFEEWIALAQVNFEDLIERNFQKAPDWEAQLKHLKVKQRDVEKVPTEIQLGCIKVATNPLKRAFEDVLKRIYDALRWTLKQSITGSLQNIEQTLTEGIEKLSNLPQTLDEVAEANQNQVNLSRSNKQVREQMHIIDEKNTLLRTIFAGGQGVENITAIKEQYERFQTLLEGHELVMKEQVDTMKANVVTRVAKLNADLEKLFELWNQFKPKAEILASDDRLALVKAVEFVREKRAQFEELSQRKEKIVNDCESFEVEVPDFPFFEEMRADLESYEANYLLYENFSNESDKLGEQEWILFRSKTYLFDEFLQQWMEKLKGLPATPVSVRLQKDIENMKEFSACLKFCRGEVLSTDHWLEMFRLLKLPRGTTLEKLTFGDLLKVQHNIVQNVEQLKALNLRAQGEVTMREAIQELEVWAAQAEFSLADYKHSNGSAIKIVKEWKNVVNQVKDNQALLQSLKNSPYYNQFKDQTSIWEKRITDLDIYLHSLNDIQRKWVYLEPIFGRGSLPAEAARFNRIDVEFRAILADIARDSRLIALCSRASMGKTLEQIADQLNRCQRSLNDFLEEKRTAFPRFYFLGDDDLLEILGQSTNPAIIQSHLKKLFQGVDKVIFDSNNENIVSVISSEGEKVQLNRIVRIVPKVETWLAQLNDEIKSTLRKLVAECLQERALNPTKYPSQILCLAEQVRFCSDVELCLNDSDSTNKLTAYKQQLNEQLEQFSRTIVEERILQLKLKALILDLVHHIDIVEQLLGTNNRSPNCWTWQKQLRFYFQAGNIMAKQAGSEIQYTYEYQGNAENLVHTPLTDKCYLTLTQALFMGLGGNPYGPAGTGKTESVKALARLLGRQVLVFNCDEGIDVQSIGRIFVGLVQCGAWGCFDEFNRLEKNVLSAVSSQIQSIQDAIRSRSGQCHLEGHHRPVIVDLNSALFVTLNPAGKGYGGRQRLPDNLKQLFRPIVMSIPDNERIAVTLLFSEGYKNAKELAKKLVTTFSLSKEMLSTQQHYDWGLRALKTVLKGCADVMINIRKQDQNASISADREIEIVVQTLQLNTLSKLTFADSERFQNLLDDIFPGVNKKIAQFESLSNGLKAAAEKLKITITDRQTKKVFELHEQLRQRTGVVIVGPTGAGKSTLWKILQEVLGHVGQHITAFTINPKSMPRNRLLGSMDLDTREWSDGILTSASREAVKDTSKPVWIICDGDIDPEWIEALNSVLDDNKLLTMPSGERIQFGDNVNFIFETDDLTHASPATISRMGMIFISGEEMDELELVRNFVVSNKDILPVQYSEWVQGPLIEAYEWSKGRYTRDMAVCNVAVIKNVLSQVRGASTKNQFLVGLLRGLWPYVDNEHGKPLVEQVILLDQSHLHGNSPLNVYCDQRTDSLISFTDDYGIEVHIDELKRLDRKPFIWTATAQAAKDIIQTWLAYGSDGQRESFIVVGDDGCGKEQLLCSCFETDHKSSVATMHCSAQTNAEHLEQLLLENCVQVSSPTGRILRPKEKENLIVYLKSPNLVKPDKYGTSSLIAFVQQMLAYKGYYGKNLDWIGLENIQIVVSVSTALGMERFSLPARLMSKLRLLKVESSTQEELVAIYTVYLSSILRETTSRSQIESLASQIVHTFEKIKSVFRAGEQFHYTFTPIDLTNWVCSLMRHHLEQEGGKSQNLYRAVTYEACRIFRDKLVNTEHKARFDSILVEFFSTYNRDEDSVYCSDLTPLNPATSQAAGKALHLLSRKDYIAQLEKCIVRYEFDMASFGQVLSDEIVELCLIMDRALTMPGGSLLIAGRSGMGHSSVAKLVAHMHQLRQICPKVSSTYSMKHFGNDLKEAMKWAAVENEQVVLIVEDYQLLNNSFLQCLNSIIASGNAPGLFTPQEFDQIANNLRNIALQDAFEGSINSYFSYKVRQNLHVIVVMDVTHKGFSSRIASNPSLYKHCGVVWREGWDRDATLHQITSLTLKKASIETSGDFQKFFAHVFDQAPPETKIPAKFIAFLNNFTLIMSKKKDGVQSRLKRLKMGVDKLTETRTSVAKMQKKAEKKRRILAEKQAEADRALLAITQSMTGANEQKSNMESLKAATQEENVKIEEQKRLIDQQLKEVEPILKEAREAVGSIKSESLSEIRSLRAPPETIRDILQAVLLFMGILDNSWESMRKFLAKSGVKEEIINFDAHRITPDVVKKIEALIKSKAASFDPKNAKRASVAAAPLATWISANLAYAKIIERIAPLENEKQMLVRNLENAEKEVEDLSKGLSSIGKKVEELKANFELSMKDATQIKIDLDREEATITVASTLVDRLRGEYDRWLEQIKTLEEEFQQMERCCLISAAFVTFIGVSTEETRDRTMKNWLDLCHLPPNFRVVSFLSAETEQLIWKEKGIPSSIIALENGSIIFNNTQTAFIVDPTGKVSAFLAEYFKSNVQVLKGSQHDYLTQVELGVRFGKTLVIEDVDDIEPALIPLLREEFSHQGPRTVVQLGEKQVDLNEKFKLFLCSKNEQIRLPEYIQSAVSVVNFSTTKSGLASQLLSLAIEIERPELEKRSSQLVSQAEVLKIQLDELEQRLLDELANSEGSLLENTQLLASLNSSKENAEKIATSLAESEQLQRELDKERNAYQQFVQKCSQLYFGINQLHNRNHVYNFNVSTIINIFKKCFAENREDQNSASRLDSLYRQLQFRVFDTVSRAMFKADRLMFAMEFIHIAQSSAFQSNEWEVFLGQLITESGENFGRWATWIPENRRNDVARLQVHLPTLFHTLNLDDQQNWASFASSSECEDTFPTLVESRLTPFQKLLVVQAIRPDRLHSCMSKFAAQMLGVKSLNISLDLQRIYKFDSSPKEPILIFIGAGADPSQELKEFADKVIGVGRFHQHAMGKGIDRAVLDNLKQCASKGDWLCLTNVHLVADSAMRIIQELSQCAAQDVFRLWLVAEPDDHFTTVFLQECLKLTYEAPPGLKNNLQRTYTQWIQNEPSNLGSDAVDVDVKLKAMFVLGWLHAMVQERRTYVPQGWLKFYEFCTADIKAGRHALDYLFQISMKSQEPDWEAFRGLMRDTIYGGRVENELDLGALQAYLSSYFNSRMITKGRELIISHDLKLPQLGSLQDYLTWITSSFPPENLPLLLGLPRNISFSWEISQSNETITQLRQLKQMGQLMSRSGSGFSRELWTQELTPLLNLWKKLNQNSTLIGRDIESQHGSRNQSDPFAEVLELEFSYAKKQVHKVHTDLTTISKSIKGTITPDMRIINLAREMLAHEIPESWDSSWTGTSNLREYMDQLVMKAKYVQSLRESSQRRSLLEDSSLDLAQLFRPTALLNALRQYTARKKGSSMERLKLTISWQASQLSAEITLTLSHLQIQGALFDGRELRSVGQTSPALSSVPPLSIAWIDEGSQSVAQQKSIVDVPLFTNMQRNDLITEVQMPCAAETRDSWIIAGVALFLA